MLIYYCETCHLKILDDDVKSGAAVRIGEKVYCSKCAKTDSAPVQNRVSDRQSTPPVRRPRGQIAPPKNRSSNTVMLLGTAGLVMAALALLLLLWARTASNSGDAQHRMPAEPSPPAVASTPRPPPPPVAPDTKSTVATQPDTSESSESRAERQRKADLEMAEIRGNRGLKLLDEFRQLPGDIPDVKAVAEQLKKLEEFALNPTPEIQAAQAAWERQMNSEDTVWTVLEPLEFSTSAGTNLNKADGNRLLASGPVPARDSFIITLATPLQEISGIRLEALADPSLPSNGPGRAVGGNFVCTKVELSVAPQDDRTKLSPAPFSAVMADFTQQDGFSAAAMLEGRADTGWAIYPQVGKNHMAVFSLAKPVGYKQGTSLRVVLKFESRWDTHIMGCVRLSATNSKSPLATMLPEDVCSILRMTPAVRTQEQNARLAAFYRDQLPEIREARGKAAQLYNSLDALRIHQRGLMAVNATYANTAAGQESAKIIKERKELFDTLNSITPPKF